MFQVTTLLTGLDPAGAAAAAAEAGTLRQAVDAQGAAVKQVRLAGCICSWYFTLLSLCPHMNVCMRARVHVHLCFCYYLFP